MHSKRFSCHRRDDDALQFHSRGGNVFLSLGGDIYSFHLVLWRLSVSWDAK